MVKQAKKSKNNTEVGSVDAVKRELMELRFQKSTGQLKDTSQMRKKKKQGARILTAAKQK